MPQPDHTPESSSAATVDLVALVNQQADRIAWLKGDVAGWRIKLAAATQELITARCAFEDALLALQELGHADVAERLRARWGDVAAPEWYARPP